MNKLTLTVNKAQAEFVEESTKCCQPWFFEQVQEAQNAVSLSLSKKYKKYKMLSAWVFRTSTKSTKCCQPELVEEIQEAQNAVSLSLSKANFREAAFDKLRLTV